jgi:hypothetical protein
MNKGTIRALAGVLALCASSAFAQNDEGMSSTEMASGTMAKDYAATGGKLKRAHAKPASGTKGTKGATGETGTTGTRHKPPGAG